MKRSFGRMLGGKRAQDLFVDRVPSQQAASRIVDVGARAAREGSEGGDDGGGEGSGGEEGGEGLASRRTGSTTSNDQDSTLFISYDMRAQLFVVCASIK